MARRTRLPIMKPGVFSGETLVSLRHIVDTHGPSVSALQHDWSLQIRNAKLLMKSIPIMIEDIVSYKLHEKNYCSFEEYLFERFGLNSLREECLKLVEFIDTIQKARDEGIAEAQKRHMINLPSIDN